MSENFLHRSFILVVLVSASTKLYAYNFEVEGTLKCTYFPPSGVKSGTNTEQNTGFVVSVDGNHWSIKTVYGEGWYSLHGCDGTNIYAINYDPHPVGPDRKTPVTLSMLPGHITEGLYPLDTAYYTTMPWLAFASSYYLDSGTNDLPPFWSMPRSDPMAWIFEAQIERSRIAPHLPLHVEFVTSMAKLESAAKNPALRVESLTRQEKASRTVDLTGIGEGKLGGEFLITATTNFNGLEIPIQFEGRTYLPQPKRTVSDGGWTYTNLVFVGTVTRIATSTNSSYVPPISEKVSVTDFRFRDRKSGIDDIQYFITNSPWLSDKDPVLVNAFKEKKNRVPPIETERARRVVVYIILGLISFIPVLFFVKNWIKQKQRNRQT